MRQIRAMETKLFPACAGVIPGVSKGNARTLSVPRMCGGDPALFTERCKENGCSPHVRG